MVKGKDKDYRIASICTAGVQDEHHDHIITDLSHALIERGFKVLLYNSFSDFYFDTPYAKGEASIYHLVNFEITDVLIVFPEQIKNTWITDAIIRYARLNRCPTIIVNGHADGCVNIDYDYAASFEEIVRHVIEVHGCKDIDFIAGIKDNRFSDERLEVFKRVMAEHSLPISDDKIGYGEFWSEPTLRVLEKFFAPGKKPPEAIICANDSMAIATIRFLSERGYRVPEDIIVTGFDAVYHDHRMFLTNITSSILDSELLANSTADKAVELLENRTLKEDIYLKFRTILNASCGCEPSASKLAEEQLLKMGDYNMVSQSHENTMIDYYALAVSHDTFDKLVQTLLDYTDPFSWLCLNDDYLSKESSVVPKAYHSVYTDTMTALQHRTDIEDGKVISFKTSELLPDLADHLKVHDWLLFAPLHYQSDIIGFYCTVAGIKEYLFHNVRRFLNITNQVLENFKNRYDLRAAYSDLEMLHFRDPLTGIFNRRGFLSAAEEMLSNAGDLDAFVFSVDMDKLKQINDNHGHTNGDIAIKETADALSSACGAHCICARFGGDEFILLGFAKDAARAAVAVEDKIHEHLEKFNSTSGKPYDVSVSMGVCAEHAVSIDDIKQMIRRSDWEMYEQKQLRHAADAPPPPEKPAETQTASVNTFEQRIHEILGTDKSSTYFYIDFIHFKWYIMDEEHAPDFIRSNSVNPLRAITQSGRVYEDDAEVYKQFLANLRKAFDEGIQSDHVLTYIRIMENDAPVWYCINLWLTGTDGRMNEVAGFIHRAAPEEIMQIEVMDYYTSADNPALIYRMFSDKLRELNDRNMAVVQFDIRRFKFINETYGEETGTDLLHSLTERLKTYCSPDQISVRLSADVFMLLTPYDTVEQLTEEIRKIEKLMSGFRNMRYEFSIGVYLVEDKSMPPRIMGDRASQARNSIKHNAIENIAFYDNKMLRTSKVRKFIEENMLAALQKEEFFIYLQPKFSISTGNALGFEALVRWKHETRGIIQPGEFIPLFEENGFIVKLDAYVWECACKVLRNWIDRGFKPLPISINVSRVHLKSNEFISILDTLISKYRLPKYLLEVEITESVENINTNRMMKEVKEHGYTLLMDDFGSGYSSLNTLKSTNFDVLKIDREFLSSFMVSEHGKKIISHTISMSKDIGLGLIAEGVETGEQADFLSACGCDTAQGFLYARPMPVSEAEKYLKSTKVS